MGFKILCQVGELDFFFFKIILCTCELLDPKIENGGYTRSGDTLLASLRSVGGFAAVFFMVLHV